MRLPSRCRYADRALRGRARPTRPGSLQTSARTHPSSTLTECAPMSRWMLWAPDGPVDLDRDALRVGSRVEQGERDVRAGVGEQPRALAEDHGDDDELDLVDEVVVEQRPDQGTAAVHLQLSPRLGFQLADGRREVTGEDGRVRPLRVGDRGRGEVLGRRVQGVGDRMAAPMHRAPVRGEEVVGPPAEQERVGALVGAGDERQGLVVARAPGPSAALEPVPAVLVRRAAVSLHHAINGDLRLGRQLHGRGFLRVGLITVRYDPTTAPNSSPIAPTPRSSSM